MEALKKPHCSKYNTRGVEGFTSYNETDGPTKVTVAANTITLTAGDRDEDYYVTKDFGANYFTTTFTHWVDVNVTALTANDNSSFVCWALSNADDDLKDIDDASGDCLFIMLSRITADTHYKVRLLKVIAGAIVQVDASGAIAVGTPSYLDITRNGYTTTIEIYSSAALRIAGGSGDVDTIHGNSGEVQFRYLYGLGSYNSAGSGYDISGTVSNLKIDWKQHHGLGHSRK